jgi:hypothetical protein
VLLQAAGDLARPGHGATLQELAARACVGQEAARSTVPRMRRRGQLDIIAERVVDYRNRPVAEYVPAHELERMADLAPDWWDSSG